MRKIRIDELAAGFFVADDFADVADVKDIVAAVKKRGDAALFEYTLAFDGADLSELEVPSEAIEQSVNGIDRALLADIKKAAQNIEKFAVKQREAYVDFEMEISPGVLASQKIIPLERVGLYVPGGRYPLVSSLLMGAVPAKVAGVNEIIICTPPRSSKDIHPVLMAAAGTIGIDRVFMAGGAHAVAAMAFGTQTIPQVDKILGPGNVYVNAAKKNVYGQVGIDFIAGPTETLIIADDTGEPSFLAADLIAQAEHDERACSYLVTDSEELADQVINCVSQQLSSLSTAEIAGRSLERNGMIIIVDDLNQAFLLADQKAPEHLQLCIKDARKYISSVKNYGSLFIGSLTAETLGDYSCGINHILPTNGAARYTGGVNVGDFLKTQTALEVTREGLKNVGPTAELLAKTEGLAGHAQAVRIRQEPD